MFNFEPQTLIYIDQVLEIPADKCLRLISVIEANFDPSTVIGCKFQNAATMALFYAPIARFAGFKNVDENELAMWFAKNPESAAQIAIQCIKLMQLLNPPPSVTEIIGAGDGEEQTIDAADEDEKK